MSTGIKYRDYAVTLRAPNASRPTCDCFIDCSDICVGPKRTVWLRNRVFQAPGVAQRLFVPPPEAWTLETVRLVAHEFAAFLPERYGHGEPMFELMVGYPCADYVTLGVSRAVHERRRVCVHAHFKIAEFSIPMQAALRDLPRGPLPLAAIAKPEGQGLSELEESENETVDSVQRQQRIARRVKDLAYLAPTALAAVETLIVGLLKKHDADWEGD